MLYKQTRQILYTMLITVAVFTFLLIGLILGQGEPQQTIPTPQATYYDTEKEQLTAQIQTLQYENSVLRDNNERLKWYMDEFYTPSQVEYMRKRAKQ